MTSYKKNQYYEYLVFNIILSIGTKSNRLLFSENDAIAQLLIMFFVEIVVLGVLYASHNSDINNYNQS